MVQPSPTDGVDLTCGCGALTFRHCGGMTEARAIGVLAESFDGNPGGTTSTTL